MPHATVNGVRLYYQQAGEGPDVVLVHAATSNLAVWVFGGLIGALAEEFRVTAYDMRGHGGSELTPTGYTSLDMASDLKALHQTLDLGPAYLVGHSYGAVVAMHTASLYPELVRGLVLSDPFFPGLADVEPNLHQAGAWHELRESFARCGLDLGEQVDFRHLFEVAAGLTEEQLERLKQEMGPGSARWVAHLPQLARTSCGRDMFEPAGLTAERLCAVHQPVVALYDEYTSFQATRRYLEENLPTCTIDVVPGARHVAPLQCPEAFVELVRKHLRRLASNQRDQTPSEVAG